MSERLSEWVSDRPIDGLIVGLTDFFFFFRDLRLFLLWCLFVCLSVSFFLSLFCFVLLLLLLFFCI